MKKVFLMACFVLMAVVSAYAQNLKISGTLVDRDTKEGVMLVTVQLLKSDSTEAFGKKKESGYVFIPAKEQEDES